MVAYSEFVAVLFVDLKGCEGGGGKQRAERRSARDTMQGDRNQGGRARRQRRGESRRETEGDRRRKSLRHG